MNNEDVKELLKRVLEITKESYKQECDRSGKILTKSDYIIKYVTTILVFINAIMVFMISNMINNKELIIAVYIVNSIILIISLTCAINAQSLLKVNFFPTGKVILSDLNNYSQQNSELYSPTEMLKDEVLYYSNCIESLEEVNKKRAKYLKCAYVFFIFAMCTLVITLVILLNSSQVKGGETMNNTQIQTVTPAATVTQTPIATNVTTPPLFKMSPLSKMRPVTEGFSVDNTRR